jgi:hypothetical protein
MVNTNDVGVVHEGDNVMTSKEKVQQIKEERKKSSWGVKVGKFVFYIILLIIFFVLGKKSLKAFGIVNEKSEPQDEKGNVEMKSNGMKNE